MLISIHNYVDYDHNIANCDHYDQANSNADGSQFILMEDEQMQFQSSALPMIIL